MTEGAKTIGRLRSLRSFGMQYIVHRQTKKKRRLSAPASNQSWTAFDYSTVYEHKRGIQVIMYIVDKWRTVQTESKLSQGGTEKRHTSGLTVHGRGSTEAYT